MKWSIKMYISVPVHKQNKICMNIKFIPKRGWVYLQSATYKVKDINISKEFFCLWKWFKWVLIMSKCVWISWLQVLVSFTFKLTCGVKNLPCTFCHVKQSDVGTLSWSFSLIIYQSVKKITNYNSWTIIWKSKVYNGGSVFYKIQEPVG